MLTFTDAGIDPNDIEDPFARTPEGDELVPFFPLDSFTPKSPCPHRGPIRKGSRLCCMICHRSGVDKQWRKLWRSIVTDPKPEKKPAAPEPKKLTRKERRSLFKQHHDNPEAAEWLASLAS